jgi:hypothetical protein
MEWQDISTAPKDGTFILVYGVFSCHPKPMIMQCGWFNEHFECVGAQFDCDFAEIPTHWMPLPKPPTE